VSFVAITLLVASQRAFIIVVVYFVIGSVRKLLDTPSYCIKSSNCEANHVISFIVLLVYLL